MRSHVLETLFHSFNATCTLMKIYVCKTPMRSSRCHLSASSSHLGQIRAGEKVRLQQAESFCLLRLQMTAARVVGISGVRIMKNLGFCKFLYVDDLVVDERERSRGTARPSLIGC
mmetsp:Transcript_15345/g.25587  ORF Transcript_15345/g.25587 Transcript_15345/m.25587 type:complete len:115 (+) Transcript_15345:427-771(+)